LIPPGDGRVPPLFSLPAPGGFLLPAIKRDYEERQNLKKAGSGEGVFTDSRQGTSLAENSAHCRFLKLTDLQLGTITEKS
jgi:hypothetical protein